MSPGAFVTALTPNFPISDLDSNPTFSTPFQLWGHCNKGKQRGESARKGALDDAASNIDPQQARLWNPKPDWQENQSNINETGEMIPKSPQHKHFQDTAISWLCTHSEAAAFCSFALFFADQLRSPPVRAAKCTLRPQKLGFLCLWYQNSPSPGALRALRNQNDFTEAEIEVRRSCRDSPVRWLTKYSMTTAISDTAEGKGQFSSKEMSRFHPKTRLSW